MNKEETKEMLKKYKEKQAKLDLKQNIKKRKIRELIKIEKDIKINITPKYIEGSKSNKVESNVENTVVNKDEKVEELKKEIQELDDEIEELKLDIEEVNIRLGYLNYLEKEIITAYYVDELSPEYIGNHTYYEIKHQTRGEEAIKKIINRILRKLENL